MTPPPGIFLVDKPVGITSFGVIARLRAQRGVKKMGHAGTLDPLASGLMIVAEGPATKSLASLTKLDKVYVAEVCLGEETTTDDREGTVVQQRDVRDPLDNVWLDEVVADMIGDLALPVPAFSAIKQHGERLYKKARRGETFETPQRTMTVHAGTLLSVAYRDKRAYLTIEWEVASGVYIRSLARELGRRLGYPARLENLRRTKIGAFSIEDAQPL